MKIKTLVFPVFFVLLMPFLLSLSLPRSAAASLPPTPSVTEPNTPMMFIENVGQFDDKARFQVQGGNRTIWLADDALWITLLAPKDPPSDMPDGFLHGPDTDDTHETQPQLGVNIKLSFVGANTTPQLEPFNRLETSVNYFTGNDPNDWHTDVPAWSGVRYVELYPGMDLEITSETGQLLPKLVCHANCQSALQRMRLQVDGVETLRLTEGQIILTTIAGDFVLPSMGVTVTDGSTLATLNLIPHLENNTVLFLPSSSYSYQPATQSLPNNLTGLLYGTFLGGSDNDFSFGIIVDGTGNAYITGYTFSANFPTTPGAFDRTINGNEDAFVVKLNPAGSGLTYATFLGGSGDDYGGSIAIEGTGNAYVAGATYSANFPTTPGAFDRTHNGGISDTFVVKLNPAGSGLAYATFVGGTGGDSGDSIVVDETGNAYITGKTNSVNFPTTSGAFDRTNNGDEDAFVVKLNPPGSNLVYATFVGGNTYDYSRSIAIDGAGNAYVAGTTYSTDFPTTPGAFDRTNNGYEDVFVVKLNPVGSALTYATFLGGTHYDYGGRIAVNGAGNAYVVGTTASVNFPTTPGAFDRTHNGGTHDAFVVKLNTTGSGLAYATFLGGSGSDGGDNIAVNGAGNAQAVGTTYSTNFPTTSGAFDPTHNGGAGDAFVVKFSSDGSGLTYATFLGGSAGDRSDNIAIDETGDAYVTGYTQSSNFPTTPGAFDTTHNGSADAFVVKLSLVAGPDLGFRPNPNGYSFSNYGGVNLNDYTISDMRQMFGDDAVCIMAGSTCNPRESAQKWNVQVNHKMDGGHCDGFTITGLRFFKNLGNSPGYYQTGANTAYDLHPNSIRRHIAYYWVLQVPNPVASARDQVLQSTPTQVLNQLLVAMSNGSPDPTSLIIYNLNRSSGHSVTPYAIEYQGNSVYWIRVYDNNHFDDANRHVEINVSNDNGNGTWSYDLGSGIGVWSGDGNSHSLGAIPISIYAQQPECPWCGSSTLLNGPQANQSQTWLDGKGHLLFTDSQGRQIGYIGNQFVNDIPGAIGSVIPGGLGIPVEPIYYLPITDTYTILLDGQTVTNIHTVDVTQFGPGYAVSVDDVPLSPATQDQMSFASDGTQLNYAVNSAKEITLTIATDTLNESYQFQLGATDIGTGQVVSMTVDSDTEQLLFNNAQTNGGQYNLEINRVSVAGQNIFVHNDITISATDTHYLDYGSWDGTGSISLHIDHGSDGTVDETVVLENQIQTTYLPLIRRN